MNATIIIGNEERLSAIGTRNSHSHSHSMVAGR